MSELSPRHWGHEIRHGAGLGGVGSASQLPPERKPRKLHAHSGRPWKESYLSSDFISPVGCPQTLSHTDCGVGALIGLFMLSLWDPAGPDE